MSSWDRQVHRWVSIAFLATVALCFIALGLGDPPEWIFFLPLPPLFVLMATGVYLLVLPYTGKGRSRQAAVRGE